MIRSLKTWTFPAPGNWKTNYRFNDDEDVEITIDDPSYIEFPSVKELVRIDNILYGDGKPSMFARPMTRRLASGAWINCVPNMKQMTEDPVPMSHDRGFVLMTGDDVAKSPWYRPVVPEKEVDEVPATTGWLTFMEDVVGRSAGLVGAHCYAMRYETAYGGVLTLWASVRLLFELESDAILYSMYLHDQQ